MGGIAYVPLQNSKSLVKFAIKAVAKGDDGTPDGRDPTPYVRKGWNVFVAYDLATSLVVSLVISAALFLAFVFDKDSAHKAVSIHGAMQYTLFVMGVLAAFMFLIQLVGGPFVFTKDVVCRKCHRRFRAKKISFFTGKYSRPPRCVCGGKIDPAFLWEPDVWGRDTPVE